MRGQRFFFLLAFFFQYLKFRPFFFFFCGQSLSLQFFLSLLPLHFFKFRPRRKSLLLPLRPIPFQTCTLLFSLFGLQYPCRGFSVFEFLLLLFLFGQFLRLFHPKFLQLGSPVSRHGCASRYICSSYIQQARGLGNARLHFSKRHEPLLVLRRSPRHQQGAASRPRNDDVKTIGDSHGIFVHLAREIGRVADAVDATLGDVAADDAVGLGALVGGG
mmetsp:Transcript_6078/g.9591  ORF Transcript_6078/g.9591 Transcript_6078/m.9591 type:complete len:216 (+) Transcript_6078:814-1461(+)